MLPSAAFSWQAQYIARIRELLEQVPKPTQQLTMLAGELWCVMAIVSEVSAWSQMESCGQHYSKRDLWASESHYHSCLVSARLPSSQTHHGNSIMVVEIRVD